MLWQVSVQPLPQTLSGRQHDFRPCSCKRFGREYTVCHCFDCRQRTGNSVNEEGQFEFKNLPAGKYTLRVSAVGYKTQEKAIEVNKDFTAVVHFQMEEESFMTDEVVVSANRNEVSRKAAPVVVNVMSAKLFEMVNSTDLAKTLNYQSGLRVENNCQNCGFPRCVSTVWKARTRKS